MARAFPHIVPTTRSFIMGDVPSTTYRSLSGTVFRRAYGNKQTGFTLDMTFKNIGDSAAGKGELRAGSGTVDSILNHYQDVNGTFESFALPDLVFRGMDDQLEAIIQSPSNISWRYAAPPRVQSVRPNISTVSVRLTGELEA